MKVAAPIASKKAIRPTLAQRIENKVERILSIREIFSQK
jgi:hypothetical protein